MTVRLSVAAVFLLLVSPSSAQISSNDIASRETVQIGLPDNPSGALSFPNEIMPGRIVGGTPAAQGAYPWFARSQVVYFRNGVSFASSSCGASLIHPRVAISAFHCVDDILDDETISFGVRLYFGANSYSGSDAVATRDVSTYHFLTAYNFPSYDIVAYIFDSPVTNIAPIAFNRDPCLPEFNSNVMAIGFGLTTDGGNESPILLELELSSVEATTCNNFFTGLDITEEELICTVAPLGKGTCQGDSGGPVFATANSQLTTFGVLSFGGTCGESPSGYIATSLYKSFIEFVICDRAGETSLEYCRGEENTVCQPTTPAPPPTEAPSMPPPTFAPSKSPPPLTKAPVTPPPPPTKAPILLRPPTRAPVLPPNDGGGGGGFETCFSGRTRVEEQTRGEIFMDALQIGDRIKTSGGQYTSVYSFGHYGPKDETEFLLIGTNGGMEELEVTPNHLLFVNNQAKKAGQVRLGDTLTGSRGHALDVTSITTSKRRGLYAPMTMSGDMLVNGVLVSNYVAFFDESAAVLNLHAYSHLLISPVRMVCRVFPDVCARETYDAAGYSNLYSWLIYSGTWLNGFPTWFPWTLSGVFFPFIAFLWTVEKIAVTKGAECAVLIVFVSAVLTKQAKTANLV